MTRAASLLAALSYTALAVVITWPLAAHLGSLVPGDVGDPVLNTWILWWSAGHVPLTAAWWNAPIFFPATGTLAFSENLLGISVLASPIIWLTHNPLLAYNVVFLLSFPLAAFTTYALTLELTGSRGAAWIAGLAFGFAPYRIAHLSHLQILATFWMPLALLGLHRYVRRGRIGNLVLFAASWALQALSNGYYLAYFSILIVFWVIWFVPVRQWRKAAAIAAAWLAAVVVLLPVLIQYWKVHAQFGLARNVQTVRALSADVASWLNASPLMSLWGGLQLFPKNEGALFTGFTVVLLMLMGLLMEAGRRRKADHLDAAQTGRSAVVFYAAAALAMYILALGPSPELMGHTIISSGPYAWLMRLPGVAALRAPGRFGMLVSLCVAIGAGLGLARVVSSMRSASRTLAAALCGAAIIAESWTHAMPLWEPPRPWEIETTDVNGALLVLPVLNELNESGSMYRDMTTGVPLVNGYSGFVPPWYRTLKEGLNLLDPAVLDELARAGVTQIAVVNRNDSDEAWRTYVRTRGTLARHQPGEAFTLFDLSAAAPARVFSKRVPVSRIEVSSQPEFVWAMTDGNLHSRWFSKGPQQGSEQVVVDLGSTKAVSAIELSLGEYEFDHPRELIVEVSPDGAEWTQAWRGFGDALVLAGAFREPTRLPMLIDLGDRTARYLRLRQIGRHRTVSWSIAELAVFGR